MATIMTSFPSSISLCLLPVLLISLLQRPSFAGQNSYVVYLGFHLDSEETSSTDDHINHHEFLASFLESREKANNAIFYSYKRSSINAFAAKLDDQVAALIADDPRVVSVFANKGRKPCTTRSWSFMGLGTSSPIWRKAARTGKDVIIANIDTGIWPESASFSDKNMGPIPSKWRGICQNDTVECNRKLIGARSFNKGYAAKYGPVGPNFNTWIDTDGHGTHTISTAAGNVVLNANIFGLANGEAAGGSPHARVATYKVCWDDCTDADILAAIDAAIHDGVDVLLIPIGGVGQIPFAEDSVAIGAFHAMMKGVAVVCSAGNDGPYEASVENVPPWIFTVGASTLDRKFTSNVRLGNKEVYQGTSLSDKALEKNKLFPLVSAGDVRVGKASLQNALLCKKGTLDPVKAKGKIVACQQGEIARVEKGQVCASAGAVGMVLANCNISEDGIIAEAHVLPATHVHHSSCVQLFRYIHSKGSPMATITPPTTVLGVKPAPLIAGMSARGPNILVPEILKPDIVAPGVEVLAAYTKAQGPTGETLFDKRRVPFFLMSGTSMSSAHVAGVVGLVKTLHPDWSPAAIKSAIMTTATTKDNKGQPILDDSYSKATPFDYGAGHMQPTKAVDPGLVYDLNVTDYFNFLCALKYNQTQMAKLIPKPYKCPRPPTNLLNFNYPSITVPKLSAKGVTTLTRTVKNVGSPTTYKVHIQPPNGVSVIVTPRSLSFTKTGEEKTYSVCLRVGNDTSKGSYVFGSIVWRSDNPIYDVRSPLVAKVVH